MARIDSIVKDAVVLELPEPMTRMQTEAFLSLLQAMPETRAAVVIDGGKSFIKFAKEIMKERNHGTH